MHYFFSLLCVTTPVHVLGPFVAHHQEAECIVWWMVIVLLLSQLSVGLGPLRCKTSPIRHTIHSAYWWWATNGPEICRGVVTLRSGKNRASCLFIIRIFYMFVRSMDAMKDKWLPAFWSIVKCKRESRPCAWLEAYGRAELYVHSFLICAIDGVSDLFYGPVTLLPGTEQQYLVKRRLSRPRAHLDIFGLIQISCPCQESNHWPSSS
jgi:hypothetical protein